MRDCIQVLNYFLKSVSLAISLGVFVLASNSEARIQADTSLVCQQSGARISEFKIDLYATGHPMAGLGMYSGFFEARAEGLDCGHLLGVADVTRNEAQHLVYHAVSNCLSKVEFELEVPTDFLELHEVYNSQLRYREFGPFGPGVLGHQDLECWLDGSL